MADEAAWPTITATAYPNAGQPELTAFPTWGQVDGLQPAVLLSIEGPDSESSIDLTAREALDLSKALARAAAAVTEGDR